MENLSVSRQVVIRRSFAANVLLAIAFAGIAVVGVVLLRIGSDLFNRFWAVAIIALSAGGAVYYFAIKSCRPLITISSNGITIPHGRRKNYIPWENIMRFEVLEQKLVHDVLNPDTETHIGIFVFNTDGIMGIGKISQTITELSGGWGGWVENPDLLINAGSLSKTEEVMEALQAFWDEYNSAKMSSR